MQRACLSLIKDQKAHEAILKALNLLSVVRKLNLKEWMAMATRCDMLHEPVRVAMFGKYTSLSDAYLSVLKALLHASVACRRKLVIIWVSATDLEGATAIESPDVNRATWNLFKTADAVVVPDGFVDRGVEGKIIDAKYARENKIPYLGICLGMQIAVIEYAGSILGLKNANSTEFDPNATNICVIFMLEVCFQTSLLLQTPFCKLV
ncbi:hypothetical protein SSX86_026650 [Deinandra increscens subsp. villosa]|uniref:CTP synthase (glutamine hydrolyzing) n=1 Tax=Deinandra increscens subsp. villosa TaxID=3103831 RepID=A0AAP0CGB2_9ASTR